MRLACSIAHCWIESLPHHLAFVQVVNKFSECEVKGTQKSSVNLFYTSKLFFQNSCVSILLVEKKSYTSGENEGINIRAKT